MKIKTILRVLISLVLASFVSAGYAGVYKCTGPQGQTIFQDHPCKSSADATSQQNPSTGSDQEIGKHFLWKASSDTHTIHLLGSIHFGSIEMYPLPDVVAQAYENSDTLIVEVNINKTDKTLMQTELMRSGSYPAGETLEDHLAPELWTQLTRAAEQQHLDLEQLQSQKPWSISLILTTLAIQRSGFSPEFGIDEYFITGAEGKKPILELESAQDQITLLSTFSSLEQNRLLKQTLDQLDQATTYFRSLLKAWRTGDAARVQELTQMDIDTDPDARKLYDALFTKRNHAMTDKIVELAENGRVLFVVVGAGHLVGEEGIIELLRGRGYEITQL